MTIRDVLARSGITLEDVVDRYVAVCKYLGMEPNTRWACEALERLEDHEVLRAWLIDGDAYDLYASSGAPSAHRYLVGVATLMELMGLCGVEPLPEWVCSERTAAGLGRFFVTGAAASLAEALEEDD
jgi:hypothetical protein